MKFLISCSSSLGDVLFSTPLIRALKVGHDNPQVHYAMQEAWRPVFQENPYIDRIVDVQAGFFRLLRTERYDYAIDLDFTISLRLAAYFTGTVVLGPDRPWWPRWLMVNARINKLRNVHIVDRLVQAAAPLGAVKDGLGLDYFIPDRDVVPVAWLPEDFRNGFVLFSIQAAYPTRKLPVKRMIELCDRINKPVILTGSAADEKTGHEVAEFFGRHEQSHSLEEGLRELNKKTVVYNGCGKFNRNQVASLARQAICVFTFDGDMVPVASAFKKQVYLILGNTITLFGRYPYHTKFVVLENNKIACRPCTSTGFNTCPKGHFKCMREIVFDFYVE